MQLRKEWRERERDRNRERETKRERHRERGEGGRERGREGEREREREREDNCAVCIHTFVVLFVLLLGVYLPSFVGELSPYTHSSHSSYVTCTLYVHYRPILEVLKNATCPTNQLLFHPVKSPIIACSSLVRIVNAMQKRACGWLCRMAFLFVCLFFRLGQ